MIEWALLQDADLQSAFRVASNFDEKAWRDFADFSKLNVSSHLAGEHVDWDKLSALTHAQWIQAFQFAPAPVVEDRDARGFRGLLNRLAGPFKSLAKKPPATLYQAGPLVLAVTTVALSRPAVPGSSVGTPLKPPRTPAALVAEPATNGGLEIRGTGRDRHGVLPAGATTSVNGPRGRTIDDWDF